MSEKIEKNKSSSKSNPCLSALKFIISLVLFLILIIVAYGSFSFLDRKSSLSAVPRNYTALVHTESIFDALDPLLDLKAADVFLSSPDFAKFRQLFMNLRSSEIRKNRLFRILSARRVDFAIYDNRIGQKSSLNRSSQEFVAVVDLGCFSGLTRPSKYYLGKLEIPYLSMNTKDGEIYFCYQNSGNTFYIKPVKNLVVASTNLDLMFKAALQKNDSGYSDEEMKLLSANAGKGFRIVADGRKLVESFAIGDEIIKNMVGRLSPDTLSVVSFQVSDSDINLRCQLPVTDEENADGLSEILSKNSTAPAILSKLADSVQYYTIVNAGTLEELKKALFPFVPKEKNIEKNWKTADSLCATSFGMGLSELIFSWTGSNFAAFGIERQNDPVFALQISDEKQRRKVFEKLGSSIFIDDSKNFILDGARLSRLQLPDFLLRILSAFEISIPSPYYFVNDGFIYFSQSAECLSEIYSASRENRSLIKSIDWKIVSSAQKPDSHLSLFYNLDRNIPFFLRSNKSLSKVLKLYNLGRMDVRVKKSMLEFQIQASAEKTPDFYSVPGFPISLDGKVLPEDFQISSKKDRIFWLTDEKKINSLELGGMKISERVLNERSFIIASEHETKSGGVLWSVSEDGTVYLFDEKLDFSSEEFPVMLEASPSARPSVSEKFLIVPLTDERIAFVGVDGKITYSEISDSSIKAPPSVCGSVVAVYDKGFMGKIYLFNENECTNEESPVLVNGIGLGSPAFMKNGNKLYMGFVSQSGNLDVWLDGNEIKNFPVKLDGVFLQNLVASGKYFYALSSDAVLYRISIDGTVLSVKIPDSTGFNSYLSVQNSGKNGKAEVFVNADSNVIYGFNENLELLSGFPLSGWGKPLFADGNGDKIDEIFALTIDRKLVAWNLRK